MGLPAPFSSERVTKDSSHERLSGRDDRRFGCVHDELGMLQFFGLYPNL